MGNKPAGVKLKPPAFAPLAAEVRRRSKPKPRRTGLLFLMVAALAVIGGSATIAARTWPNAFSLNTVFALTAAKKPEPAPSRQVGHIIVNHDNSPRCDHFLFDNKSGGIRAVENSTCGKREVVKIVDQVNSFSSSWRGAR